MAVYREGYSAIKSITQQSVQIFSDACDFGAPVKVGSTLWNELKQLVDWYKIEGTVKKDQYGCSAQVLLMDEWAVSDEKKTVAQATEIYDVSYTKCTTGRCSGFDGFITVSKK